MRTDPVRRRSPAEWGVRATLAVFAAALGYAAVAHSLANLLPDSAADKAYALAPWNGKVAARLSRMLAQPDADEGARARSDALARKALLREPTAVAAATSLGLSALAQGKGAESRRLFSYAEMLSRRDLQTQLWAIEDAVARDDIPSALKHYDTALRTSRLAPDLLYPILASASSDAEIRAALIRTLAAKPAWSGSFIDYAVRKIPDSRDSYALFSGLRHMNVPVSDLVQKSLIARLVSDKLYDQAWAYYASVRPAASRALSRDPRFAANHENPSMFDWAVSNDAEVSAVIQQGVFDFAASSAGDERLLSQTQFLPRGDYVLEGHGRDIDASSANQLFWTLRCLSGGEISRVPMAGMDKRNGAFRGQVQVPAGCPVQVLTLTTRGNGTTAQISGKIGLAQLRPAHIGPQVR